MKGRVLTSFLLIYQIHIFFYANPLSLAARLTTNKKNVSRVLWLPMAILNPDYGTQSTSIALEGESSHSLSTKQIKSNHSPCYIPTTHLKPSTKARQLNTLWSICNDMDIARAAFYHTLNLDKRPSFPIDLPDDFILNEMEQMIKRGIPITDLKDLFFRVPITKDLVVGQEEESVPAFLSSVEDNFAKVIGSDSKPILQQIDPKEHTVYDVLCQTLISAINTEDDQETDLDMEEVDPNDVFSSLLENFFVPGEFGLPEVLYSWNKSYLKGLANVDHKRVDAYNQIWYGKLKDFMLHYVGNFKKVIEPILQEIKFDTSEIPKFFDFDTDTDDLEAPAWTEFLSPHILKFIAKHEAEGWTTLLGPSSLSNDDVKADLLKAYIALYRNRYFNFKLVHEKELLRRKFIRFCYERRHGIKNGALSLPPMPYWIWHEFWHRRESLLEDTLAEILQEIRQADPSINLSEIIRGTREQLTRPIIDGKRGDVRNIFQSLRQPDLAAVNNLVSGEPHPTLAEDHEGSIIGRGQTVKYTSFDPTSFGPTGVKHTSFGPTSFGPTGVRSITAGSMSEHAKQSTLLGKSGSDPPKFPYPLGYYFKDVLSHDKFVQAYHDFNMHHFGTPDFDLYNGQLVEGTVYYVRQDRVIVDIKAPILATMLLRNYYKTPQEVPRGGFLKEFKKGDVLIFEVVETWPDQITLSMLRIKAFHRSKEMIRRHIRNEIFYVKVLERYTRGILVKYDDREFYGPGEELAWIPLNQIASRNRHKLELIPRDLVGKRIPAIFHFYKHDEDRVVLSNLRALRLLQLMHMRVGDVVQGPVAYYKEKYTSIKVGEVYCYLQTGDMSWEEFNRHMREKREEITARVKRVDMKNAFVELETKTLDSHSPGSRRNRFLSRYKNCINNVWLYNNAETKSVGKDARDNYFRHVEILGVTPNNSKRDSRSYNMSYNMSGNRGGNMNESTIEKNLPADSQGSTEAETSPDDSTNTDESIGPEDSTNTDGSIGPEEAEEKLAKDFGVPIDEKVEETADPINSVVTQIDEDFMDKEYGAPVDVKNLVKPIRQKDLTVKRDNRRAVRWNLLGDEDDELMDGEDWVNFGQDEQRIINRAFNMLSDVVYYRKHGIQYKIDFTRSHRLNIGTQEALPIRIKN